MPKSTSSSKGRDNGWKTINGTHVFIGKDGTISKGPSHMVGKKPSEVGGSSDKTSSSGKTSSKANSGSRGARANATHRHAIYREEARMWGSYAAVRASIGRNASKPPTQLDREMGRYSMVSGGKTISKTALTALYRTTNNIIRGNMSRREREAAINAVLDKYARSKTQRADMEAYMDDLADLLIQFED